MNILYYSTVITLPPLLSYIYVFMYNIHECLLYSVKKTQFILLVHWMTLNELDATRINIQSLILFVSKERVKSRKKVPPKRQKIVKKSITGNKAVQ